MTVVDQVLGSASPYDATRVQTVAWAELMSRTGITGGVFAADLAPGIRGEVRPLRDLANGERDLLIVHYTGFVRGMRRALELPGPKMLVYHNITPARYFWNLQPYVATVCQLGRDALPGFVRAARVCAGVSRFNADELRAAGATDPLVTPILLDPTRLEPTRPSPAVPRERPLVLAVGRLAPHKRHDLLLRAFALFQRRHAPGAALLCVGSALDASYLDRLHRIAAECGARRVTFVEDLPQAELNGAYAEADVLLSMSEHEGFCVPLLEAFHFGVPVVARRAGAMPEVAGDAALWVEADDHPGVVAELLRLALEDAGLREELVRRGRERAQRFSYERSAALVTAAIAAALDGEPQSKVADQVSTSRIEEASGPGTVGSIK